MSGRPFLKWVGGKRQLLPQILPRLPERIGTYFEPFIGGGAVFFALAAEGRFRRAVISDANPDLICTYRTIATDVEGVIDVLSTMKHSPEDYYQIRSWEPELNICRAARLIYLNRTGFNGLYRVNRAGKFNVPFGRHKNPTICDSQNLRAVSQVLQGVEIRTCDFAETTNAAQPGDAVYFDPPYVPASNTASFRHYHRDPFGPAEHERLASLFRDLHERGASAVLSNSDTAETRALYSGFEYDVVSARRSVNSNASKRGPVGELLVHGLGADGQAALFGEAS